jgi:hypothetical protein
MLLYQEGGWFSSRMLLSWTEVKVLLIIMSMELRPSRVRTLERMLAMKTILNRCRCRLPLRARASISSGAMSTLSVSGSRETAGRSSSSLIRAEKLEGDRAMERAMRTCSSHEDF